MSKTRSRFYTVDKSARQHELVSELCQIAAQLGHTPSRAEYHGLAKCKTAYVTDFGTWAVFIQAAGLEPAKRRKIDNSIFQKNIEAHLEQYEPAPRVPSEPYKKCLFIGDAHHPFTHWPTIEKICKFAEIMKPEIIVQMGDLYDHMAHSRFPKSMNTFLAKDEHKLGRLGAEKMWKDVQSAAPGAKCYQISGNHDAMPLKRILETVPAMEDWIEKIVREIMTFPNVTTIYDPREELILPGNVQVIHGYKSGMGDHRDYARMNTVSAHTHRACVSYRPIRGSMLWELSAGYTGDQTAKGLSWTPQRTTDWVLGWGWLDEWGPRFCPA